jgi:1-phosphofructokinase
MEGTEIEHKGRIITLGLTPAWDMICRGSHLAWGEHPVLEQQTLRPAGKALNISLALAWLGQESVTTGLWGQDDYAQMQHCLQHTAPQIKLDLTPVPGRTRINVTVLDQAKPKELHLRCPSTLCSREALQTLVHELAQAVRPHDICIMAGSLPSPDLNDDVLGLCRTCVAPAHTRLVLDAHGPMFKKIINAGLPWLIKPNVAELNELLGRRIKNTPACLMNAARELLDRVEMVLVSRGKLGAVLVTRTGAWQGRCTSSAKVVSTVGCGDFLLAGFVQGMRHSARVHTALALALKVATARAWAWPDCKTWRAAQRGIRVDVERL